MFSARLSSPDGEKLFITEFLARYGSAGEARGVRLFCSCCKEPVHKYVSTVNPDRNHFAHFKKRKETPDCIRRVSKEDPWCGFFKNSEQRLENVDRLRAELQVPETKEKLIRCANSILRISKVPAMTKPEFRVGLKRAYDLGLWAHDKIQTWMVPFVVLTVGDFVSGQDEVHYRFGFRPGSHRLVLIPARTTPEGTVEDRRDFPVSEETVERLSKPWRPDAGHGLKEALGQPGQNPRRDKKPGES